jgi:hypothetical protein
VEEAGEPEHAEITEVVDRNAEEMEDRAEMADKLLWMGSR